MRAARLRRPSRKGACDASFSVHQRKGGPVRSHRQKMNRLLEELVSSCSAAHLVFIAARRSCSRHCGPTILVATVHSGMGALVRRQLLFLLCRHFLKKIKGDL